MKKILLIVMLCFMASLTVGAQKQNGKQYVYIRTLEKPKSPSKGIQGVQVNISEYGNTLISDAKGEFSFVIPGKKEGKAFKVLRVWNKDYVLVDKQVEGRNYPYSTTVRLEIVMVSKAQLAKDIKMIEDKAYDKAQKNYETQIAELKCRLEKKTINEQAYYAEREHLDDYYKNYLQLIREMAERYALTDYKGLSELDRKIAECIENAELERADSLINSKGDFDKREQEIHSLKELSQKTSEFLSKTVEETEFKLNELAQDYYFKYAIHIANYQNDSAAYYLERRVALDTTNIEWLYDVGKFMNTYMGKYDLAMQYFQSGLAKALEQYGGQSDWVATFYEEIGLVCLRQGYYSQALENQMKALSIFETNGMDSLELASVYNNIGGIYYEQGRFRDAINYHLKSLDLSKRIFGANHPELAASYNNIGSAFCGLGDYKTAFNYFWDGLGIVLKSSESDQLVAASSYNNLGSVFMELGNYEQALECCEESLVLHEQVFGPEHPIVALIYGNIASILEEMGHPDLAFELYQKSLSIRQRVLNPNHPDIAQSYDCFGNLYKNQGDSVQALENYRKSLAIRKQLMGSDYSAVARSYDKIGSVYEDYGDSKQALANYLKALSIRDSIWGQDYPDVATSYDNIGAVYLLESDTVRAVEYFMKALAIRERVLGSEHTDLAISYNNVGTFLIYLQQNEQALMYLKKAFSIYEKNFAPSHPYVASCCYNVCVVTYYLGYKDQTEAYYRKLLDIYESAENRESTEIQQVKYYIEEIRELIE